MIVVFLYVLGFDGYASRGIQLIMSMQITEEMCLWCFFTSLVLLDLHLEGFNFSYG